MASTGSGPVLLILILMCEHLNMFTDDQLSSLGDMLQGSLMLRYNKRQM